MILLAVGLIKDVCGILLNEGLVTESPSGDNGVPLKLTSEYLLKTEYGLGPNVIAASSPPSLFLGVYDVESKSVL